MKPCECRQPHARQRVVLTGGPGAGKTAVLEIVRQSFCQHVKVLPEAAGIVFGGGFPRGVRVEPRRASQRAIFYLQRELEVAADDGEPCVVLCDRGTVDGQAYWPGDGDLFTAVGTSLGEQLARYDAVIHLRTPTITGGYNHDNPLRTESAAEAADIDRRITLVWAGHPRRCVVEPTPDFLGKASRALEILWNLLPACCRNHGLPRMESQVASQRS